MAILGYLKNFNDFRLDALGLVTLLGASEMANAVGRLTRNRYLEYLPLLGAFLIASNAFAVKQPGFTLYNPATGFSTTDMAGWFTRWMVAQDLLHASTCIDWNVTPVRRAARQVTLAFAIGLVFQGGFLALNVLMSDWWGCANAASMICSTTARAILVDYNRSWLNAGVERSLANENIDPEFRPHALAALRKSKLLVVSSDARIVAMFVPDAILFPCFIFNPRPPVIYDETRRINASPPNRKQRKNGAEPFVRNWSFQRYLIVRLFAWVAFGIHIISIGMSCLVSQLITVALLVISTLLFLWGFGFDDMHVGNHLSAKITDMPHVRRKEQKRVDLFAFLDLNDTEMDALVDWQLAPKVTSTRWWTVFSERRKLYNHPIRLCDLPSYEARDRVLRQRLDEQRAVITRNKKPSGEQDVGNNTKILQKHIPHDSI